MFQDVSRYFQVLSGLHSDSVNQPELPRRPAACLSTSEGSKYKCRLLRDNMPQHADMSQHVATCRDICTMFYIFSDGTASCKSYSEVTDLCKCSACTSRAGSKPLCYLHGVKTNFVRPILLTVGR